MHEHTVKSFLCSTVRQACNMCFQLAEFPLDVAAVRQNMETFTIQTPPKHNRAYMKASFLSIEAF